MISAARRTGTGLPLHIGAARETGLPLVIHTREAEDDTARVLEEEMGKGAFMALLHCFTSQDLAGKEGPLNDGLYVSFSGILTYKTAENLRATAAGLPEDRILLKPTRPISPRCLTVARSNEPAFVVKTLEHLAKARGTDTARMARITSDNFFRLFSKVPKPEAYA
jgi:TatD DNase family protein